jgi:hypothetical protein
MTDAAEYCLACSLWHTNVPCDHRPEAPCLEGCGRQRGFRWLSDDRREVKPRVRCWHCAWRLAGNPPLPPMGQGAPAPIDGCNAHAA